MAFSGLTFQRAALRAVCALLVLLALSRAAVPPADLAGTMPEDYLPGLKSILEAAFQRSPQLIAADFDRTLAEVRIMSADAGRLPNVGGNLNYANNQTAISSNTSSQTRDNGLFYNIGVTQPLFHWRALQNQSALARLNLLISQKSYERATRDLGVILRKAYLALVVEKARLRAAQDVLQLMRNEIPVTAEKKERGTVSSATLEGDKLRVREVQLDVDRVATEFDANRRRFARLAGLADLPEAAVPDEIPAPRFSPELAAVLTATALRDGAKSTLEWEIADMRVRDAMLRISSEKVRLYPKFFANAGYSLENSTNINGNAVNQQGIQRRTVSVYAQWSIFDGFATRAAVREALVSKRVQERLQQAEIDGILQNIQIFERYLKLDAEQLELSAIRHGMAIESRKVIAREFEFGNVPKGDLDRAQGAILQAEAKQQESRATLLGRWSEFVALASADPALHNPSFRHVREKK
jgi:outer membrane protein TolC